MAKGGAIRERLRDTADALRKTRRVVFGPARRFGSGSGFTKVLSAKDGEGPRMAKGGARLERSRDTPKAPKTTLKDPARPLVIMVLPQAAFRSCQSADMICVSNPLTVVF